ncbi:ubiquinol-cytochrome c reductase iron-sulfur subunit [Mucilaginibacter sp. UYCu711]|uniref:QcrA and Rieske domain-containing protein n=1 Tax=Mucilaginibacter sp. UYCu711 TaxID=3156339 RepID=UPI003D1BF2C9
MEREEFLSKLGIGALAVCMGSCLAACSKSGNAAPSNNNGNSNGSSNKPPASGTTITTDLSSSLTSVGDSKVSDGVIIVRIATGNTASAFTAVQVACTHEGTAIGYNSSQNLFICPLHGSIFSKSGAVVQGPANTALKQYTVTITNNMLTVVT